MLNPGEAHTAVGLPRASELALLLLELDGVVDRLIAAHVPGYDGYCLGCALPQTGQTRWPCTLHSIAVEAQTIARARALPPTRRRPP
jgi:hypothetical protein